MSTEINVNGEKPQKKARIIHKGGGSEAVYGFGLLGAWFYYISTATSFGMGLLGILKGIIWPAMLVYEAMKYLGL